MNMPYCWILYFWMASAIVTAISFPLGQMRSKGYYAFTVFFIAANGVLAWITPSYDAINDHNASCRERAYRQLVELRQPRKEARMSNWTCDQDVQDDYEEACGKTSPDCLSQWAIDQLRDQADELRDQADEIERLRESRDKLLAAIDALGVALFGTAGDDLTWREAKAEWWQQLVKAVEAAEKGDARCYTK